MRTVSRSVLLFVSLSIAAAGSATDAFADILTNGGFETGDFTGWTQGGNYNTGTSYTAVSSANPTNGYYVYAGSYAAQLGPQSTPGTLSQTFFDTAGAIYNVTFALHGDPGAPLYNTPNNFFDASVAPLSTLNLTNVTSGYQLYTFSFIGLGTDTLKFTFEDNDNYLSLDSVSITPQVAATPEPSSLILLGTGVLGLATMARRRIVNA